MDKVVLSAPFAKTVETEDGGREVWGFATLEVKDKSGEIADFDGTLKAFEKWSQETEERTGGKSKGNVRVMHQPITAGKTIHWEPTETTVLDDDGNEETVKGIWVGAYVPPTKADVVRDIDEGILSAFSIGGSYEKRWWSQDDQAFRFIPELSEYSLVDNPCVPGADIVNVIEKSGGPWNRKEGETMKKTSEAKGTFEELRSLLNRAVNVKLGGGYWFDGYIVATYPAKVIVYNYDEEKYFELPYDFDGETVSLGDAVEVTIEYVPLEARKSEEAQKAARSDLIDDAITRFNENVEKANADEMGLRIAKAASQLKGGEYIFENGKVIKKEGENMNLEQIRKAAEAAGLKVEQIQEFFKALTPVDEPPSPATVTTVDGDGDEDDNKEFPNPPEAGERINIDGAINDVKASEKESGVAKADGGEEITSDDDQPTQGTDGKEEKCAKCGKDMSECKCSKSEKAAPSELEKAGKSISKKNAAHMQHAVNHIDAALKSADYTAEDHLTIESQMGQGLTGEEAPEVSEKLFQTAFTKSIGNVVESELAKSLNGFTKAVDDLKTMVKGLASKDELSKAVSELEAVKALVKEIHETPQAGGPLLNGGNPAIFAKNFNQVDVAQVEGQALEKFVKEVKDPVLKDRLGQELAARKMRDVFNQ